MQVLCIRLYLPKGCHRHHRKKNSAILEQYTTHLGCHKGKRVNASVEVADRNADGQQAEAAHVNTKQQKQNLAVRQQWRGRRK